MSVVQLSFADKIATLTIQRPEALNALNHQVLEELSQHIEAIQGKSFSEVRAVIITGSGEKAFVAGADIKEINQLDPASAKKFADKGQSLFRRIEALKVPVVAAVNGFALGGGLELALACDFILASENAKFGLPEVSLGLIPGFGGTVRLSRIVGLNRAREIIFTGDMIPAALALDIGLANKVVPLAELLPTAKKIIDSICSRGPLAVAAAKRSVLKCFDLDLDAAMACEAGEFAKLFESKDVKEGTSAFVEKRKANFTGQ